MIENSSVHNLQIIKPDDWHLHLRSGETLKAVLPSTIKWANRAIIMPNLDPPIVNIDDVKNYFQEIKRNIPSGVNFDPLMTLYLTETTKIKDILEGYKSGIVKAIKYYPSGATTNSAKGVKNIKNVYKVFDVLSKIGMPLLIHGEVTSENIDIFDREKVFIEQILDPLRNKFPDLKIVFEHITTTDAIDYILNSEKNLAATITPHHLIINRNSMLVGGIKPDFYCLPLAKREKHRLALVKSATSGSEKFFLGTDSAPHLEQNKISECGCAGIFNALNAIPCLAQVFDNENLLNNLEKFVSLNGPKFYDLPVNKSKINIVKYNKSQNFLKFINTSEGRIRVFNPNLKIYWNYT